MIPTSLAFPAELHKGQLSQPRSLPLAGSPPLFAWRKDKDEAPQEGDTRWHWGKTEVYINGRWIRANTPIKELSDEDWRKITELIRDGKLKGKHIWKDLP